MRSEIISLIPLAIWMAAMVYGNFNSHGAQKFLNEAEKTSLKKFEKPKLTENATAFIGSFCLLGIAFFILRINTDFLWLAFAPIGYALLLSFGFFANIFSSWRDYNRKKRINMNATYLKKLLKSNKIFFVGTLSFLGFVWWVCLIMVRPLYL